MSYAYFKYLRNFLLIIFFINSAEAQIYHPFPTDSAEWSNHIVNWPMTPLAPNSCIANHYGLNGDTIINGIRYSRLFANNINGNITDTSFNIYNAEYMAAIREDTGKKVWVRMPGDSVDILYYDFSLGIGDTFCFDYFGYGCFYIDFIDSVLVDNQYRKKLNFYVSNGQSWIEGIGSTVVWFTWQHAGTFENYLSCYKEKGILIYGNNCHCNTLSGIDDKPEKLFQIFPNPVTDQLTISIGDDIFFDMEIISISGAVIMTLSDIKKKVEIDVSHLPAGVYLIKLRNQNFQDTRKIFKK